jgi:hypothetical protein
VQRQNDAPTNDCRGAAEPLGSSLLLLLVLFGHGPAGGLRLATLVLRLTATLLAATLMLTALLLTHLVLVELDGAPALLIVPVLVHPLLFLIHGADSLVN